MTYSLAKLHHQQTQRGNSNDCGLEQQCSRSRSDNAVVSCGNRKTSGNGSRTDHQSKYKATVSQEGKRERTCLFVCNMRISGTMHSTQFMLRRQVGQLGA